MMSPNPKFALYGGRHECARTNTLLLPLSEVSTGTVSLTPYPHQNAFCSLGERGKVQHFSRWYVLKSWNSETPGGTANSLFFLLYPYIKKKWAAFWNTLEVFKKLSLRIPKQGVVLSLRCFPFFVKCVMHCSVRKNGEFEWWRVCCSGFRVLFLLSYIAGEMSRTYYC